MDPMDNVVRRFNRKRFLLLILSIVVVVVAFVGTWIIVTPNWSFSVSTDKVSYRRHENVTITVSLENLGYITHSFKSCISDPVYVRVENVKFDYPVWYSLPIEHNITEFSIGPSASLKRTFVWNQTVYSEYGIVIDQLCPPGTYHVKVYIPEAQEDALAFEQYLFRAYTTITIKSY